MTNADAILPIIRALRVGLVQKESELHETIALALLEADITFEREVWLDPEAKTSRVDFLLEGGVVLEIKKHKPHSNELRLQITRYAKFPKVHEIIVIVGGSVFAIEPVVNGKPVHYIALHKLHGIAL